MNRPGRRSFMIASVFLLLVGCLHLYGESLKSTDPALLAIQATQRAFHLPLGLGMAPSLLAIEKTLSLTMSIMLLWLGALGVLIGMSDASAQVLRRFTIMNVVGCGALVMLFAHYRVPPPLVMFALVEMMFVLSLLRQAMGLKR